MSQEDRQRLGLAEGTVVDGRYQIESELGRGGFARVYRAAHVDLGRAAALKVIDLPQQAGAVDMFIERFLREARIAANLSHPNVVTVYDYGIIQQTGQPYLAMELLEGWDLEMVLAHHGPMEPPRAIARMVDVLDALSVAQSKGIVHKDLKPSNLFLVGEGTTRERLVLIDFGIARMWDDAESRITQTGGFTGTPAYFAPEYVDRQIVTPAIDVYQCGLILVEMMTGVPAVTAETSMQYLIKHCAGQVDIPPKLLESPLGPVLLNALAVDHQARYPDCGAFRDALAAVDVDAIPVPRRHRGGPVLRGDTLEHPPTTGEFAHEVGMAATVAPNEGATSPETPRALGATPPVEASANASRGRGSVGGIVAVLVVVLASVVGLRNAQSPDPVPATPPTVATPPPAADPPPAPAASEPAVLTSVPDNAIVEIDGTVFGSTPVKLGGDLLDGGEHQVTLRKTGFEPVSATVSLRPGETVPFELRPTPAKKETTKTPKREPKQRRKPREESSTTVRDPNLIAP